MFHADPILWLQSWASPPMTRVMEVVSWFGYTRAAIALVTLTAFTHRLRPALAVLILIGLNAVATDVVKNVVARPRPYLVDHHVAALGAFVSDGTVDSDSGFGFPSGHVATTTTLLFGWVLLYKWPSAWVGFMVWLPLMALSRLYLGRHFIGDVLGAVVIATATTLVAISALGLRDLAESRSTAAARRVASRSVVVAVVIVAMAWIVGRADIGDAGRLLGFASAALFIVHVDVPDAPRSWSRRGLQALLAAGGFAVVWVIVTFGLRQAGVLESPAGRLAAGALPAAAMLLGGVGPVFHRSGS